MRLPLPLANHPLAAGYLQAQKGARLQAPSGVTTATLVISPGFSQGEAQATVTAPVHPKFGSLHARVAVPSTTKPGQYSVALQNPGGGSEGGGQQLTSAAFTVANPRPPTAALNLTAPAWVRAHGWLLGAWRVAAGGGF